MDQIAFLNLNENIAQSLVHLTVKKTQTHLITSNPSWLIEAIYDDCSTSYAIYLADIPVGLISLIDPRVVEEQDDDFQHDCLFVWRMMVDQHYQGRGIGKQAVEFAISYANLIGLKGVSLTTMDKVQGNALPFYQQLGFVPTGRRIDDEIELIYKE